MKKLLVFLLLTSPLSASWSFYYKATVVAAQAGSSNSSNFTVLIRITGDANMKDSGHSGLIQNTTTYNGQTVPADLGVFTDAGCVTQVTGWDIGSYDGTNGNVELWFGPVTLSHTVDGTYYLCFDNSTQSTYLGGSVGTPWDSGHVWISHLSNGTSLLKNCNSSAKICDYSSNANNGAPTNTPTATAGEIDGAASFTGASSQFILDTNLINTGSVTIDTWVSIPSNPAGNAQVAGFASGNGGATHDKNLGITSGGKGVFSIFQTSGSATITITGATTITTSTLHHLVAVVAATGATTGSCFIYLDSVQDATATCGNSFSGYSGANVLIGGITANNGFAFSTYLTMVVDEVKVSNVGRSADWILAEYNMTKPSPTLVTLGAKTAVGGSTGFPIVAELGDMVKIDN